MSTEINKQKYSKHCLHRKIENKYVGYLKEINTECWFNKETNNKTKTNILEKSNSQKDEESIWQQFK